jgi:hypothetical protein
MYEQSSDRENERSIAERELSIFIHSVTNLLGPEPTKYLTEIWMDEVAALDIMPGPTSLDWRLVTVAAAARLASRLVSLDRCQADIQGL